jgi:hypothetical protein
MAAGEEKPGLPPDSPLIKLRQGALVVATMALSLLLLILITQ